MKKTVLKEWISAFIDAAIIAIVLYFLFWPFLIEGSSMESTFKTGDRVLVSRIAAYMNLIDYNDIILCKIDYNGYKETIVKRVIGKPGDRITIKDSKVYINNSLLIEPYIQNQATKGDIDITLADDEYYILGDNRNRSTDSRVFGAIKESDIEAKVVFKWYPFGDMGFVN